MLHGYQAASFVIGVYFMPLAATIDKWTERSPSSFARTVEHLRTRTGRLDPTLPSQLARLDMPAVALYVPGDVERYEHDGRSGTYHDTAARGVVRYFDVLDDPPFRARPRVETTLSLTELTSRVAERYRGGGSDVTIDWAEPESAP